MLDGAPLKQEKVGKHWNSVEKSDLLVFKIVPFLFKLIFIILFKKIDSTSKYHD